MGKRKLRAEQAHVFFANRRRSSRRWISILLTCAIGTHRGVKIGKRKRRAEQAWDNTICCQFAALRACFRRFFVGRQIVFFWLSFFIDVTWAKTNTTRTRAALQTQRNVPGSSYVARQTPAFPRCSPLPMRWGGKLDELVR